MIRTLFALTILALLAAHAAALDPAEQQSWNAFMAWYKTYSGPPDPPAVMKAYAQTLVSAGKSEADVKDTLAVLRKVGANPPPEMLTLHFNKIFTQYQDLFIHEPNALLVRTVRGLKPGKALDVAMGQGRNSVFLAMQGWDVTGYDLSDEGLAAAKASAAKAGVRIHTVLSTHDKFDYGKDQWDLVVMTYAFVNMEDQAMLRRIRESLKPGGLIVLEQLNAGGAGKGPANALLKSFPDLRVIHYEDVVDVADWSKKPARMGRIVLERD